MSRQIGREGALLGTSERNRLAAELRARRTGKPVEQPRSQWTSEEVAEMEDGDREFQKQIEEIKRLKDRLLP